MWRDGLEGGANSLPEACVSRNLAAAAAAVVILIGMVVGAEQSSAPAAKRTAQEEMAAVNYLVGTWNCGHVVGNFSGKYKTTWSKPEGGLWLKQTYDFPAGQAGEHEAPVTAEALMAYNEARQQWVRFFGNSLGQYFAIRMSDSAKGWEWRYTSLFSATPDKAQPDATFTKKSDKEYVIDGPTYPLNGTQVTEHHSCQKL